MLAADTTAEDGGGRVPGSGAAITISASIDCLCRAPGRKILLRGLGRRGFGTCAKRLRQALANTCVAIPTSHTPRRASALAYLANVLDQARLPHRFSHHADDDFSRSGEPLGGRRHTRAMSRAQRRTQSSRSDGVS